MGGRAQYLMQGLWEEAGAGSPFRVAAGRDLSCPLETSTGILLNVPMGQPGITGLTRAALGRYHAPEPASSATVIFFLGEGGSVPIPKDHSR